MTIDSAITRFRAKQAEQFTETVTVLRPVGELEWDPDTGDVDQDYDDVYDGPCKIRPTDRSGLDTPAGETEIQRLDEEGKFPVDTDVRRDDIVLVTASLYDAGMVNATYRVTTVPKDGWQIARVTTLEQITVPTLNAVSA